MMSPRNHRDRPHSRRLGTVVIATSLLLLSGATGVADESSNSLPLPDNPTQGRLLFESRHCHQCHGIGGNDRSIGATDRRVGPDLGDGRFVGSFLDLGAALWNHVPGMSAHFDFAELSWPELSDEAAIELTAFLYFINYLGRPGDAEVGRRLFETRSCNACHTLGDQGNAVGPDLADLQRFASPLFIAQAIWNHGPSMLESMEQMRVPPPRFEEGDVADLSAYVRQAARPGPLERMLLTPGNPNRGADVFESKGCTSCHRVNGRGGNGGPDLAEADLHRSADAIAGIMWNHALEMENSMRKRGVPWPRFTTTELADLIAFLYFLPFADAAGDATRGAEVFATKSCADCHTQSDQVIGHAGPDLIGTGAARSRAALVATMWNHAPVMSAAILAEGRPWPVLNGDDLRDLYAYLEEERAAQEQAP